MNSPMLWLAVLLSAAYGALTAFGGFGQTRAGKIQSWSAWGLVLAGLLVLASGGLTLVRDGAALPLLAAGLLVIHALAINNGLRMFGRINPSHHLVRLAVSVLLLGLTYFVLR